MSFDVIRYTHCNFQIKEMELIKVLLPEVAKEVGTTAALLLQHINYWMFTQSKNIIFRTNNELVNDLNNMFTLFQIQYAKKKLVEKGFLVVTYDKKYDRTSHYTFTEKAISLLKEHTDYLLGKNRNKTSRKTTVNQPYNDFNNVSGTYLPVSEENAISRDYEVSDVSSNVVGKQEKTLVCKPQQMTNKGMQKAFSEYGEKREEVKKGVPDALKHLLRKKGDESNESNKPDLTPINEEDVVNNTIVEQCDINDITESNIDHFDINQNASLATILSKETLETVSIFKRPPNVDISNKRMYYQEQVLNFKEDW